MPVRPSSVKQQAAQVLGLLSRAQAVFGGDEQPVAPPESRTPRDPEDNLGRGFFDGATATDARPRPGDATAGGESPRREAIQAVTWKQDGGRPGLGPARSLLRRFRRALCATSWDRFKDDRRRRGRLRQLSFRTSCGR